MFTQTRLRVLCSLRTRLRRWLRNSVAVLPFLDLTSESMDQEYLPTGSPRTHDRLSKIPGLACRRPRPPFISKARKWRSPISQNPSGSLRFVTGAAQIGFYDASRRALGACRQRVCVWSETYDRRMDDSLKVQDDIASEVVRALGPSIDGTVRSAATGLTTLGLRETY